MFFFFLSLFCFLFNYRLQGFKKNIWVQQKVGMVFFFFYLLFFSIHYSQILFRSAECEIYGFTMLSNQFHLVSPSFPLTHLRMALSNYCLCVWFLDWQFLRVFFFLIIKKRRRNFVFVCLFVCLFVYYYYYYYYYYCVFMFV